MRILRVSLELATWTCLLLVTALLLAGCSEGNADAFTGEAADHSLAVALHSARPNFQGLDDTERAAIDTFIRHAGPRSSKFEIRRILKMSGKGLKGAPPVAVADFLVKGADHVYQEFFGEFDDSELAAITEALRDRPGADAATLRRYRSIVSTARNGYTGPLSKAVGIVLFAEAVEPKPIPRAKLTPAADDPKEIWTGCAELLRMNGFVAEGPRVDLALKTYRQAIAKWPRDAVLISGLVTLYVEYEDRYPEEFAEAVKGASVMEPGNAAYAYLVAARAFRLGHDDKALAILGSVKARKLCTFHAIERAKRVVVTLERAGYGKMRARLTAYRTISLAPYFDIKDLANRAILRSQEYEAEKRADALKTVLEFPGVLSRQISASPRVHHVERIRSKILAVGQSRHSSWLRKSDRRAGDRVRNEAVQAELRFRALERGKDLASGRVAWAAFYDMMGEEEFLRYVDCVLFGNEAEFLIRCSEKKAIEQVVDLARGDYPF